MAIIHQRKNYTEKDFNAAVNEYVRDRIEQHKAEVAARPKQKRRQLITAIICAAVFIIFLCNPGIVSTAKEAVRDGLDNFAEWLVKISSLDGDTDGILGVILSIVRLVFWLIMRMIVATVIHMLASIAKFLTAVVMYGLPLVAAGFSLMCYFGGDPGELNMDAVRREAEEYAADEMEYDAIERAGGDRTYDNLQIAKAGKAGEQSALWFVSGKLDNSYHIFTNLHVPHEGKESEVDMVVLGPNGVTIVELKSYKGLITGDISDHDLVQQRTQGGKTTRKTFYNPVKQVGTHVYRTANYLRGHGCNVNVRSCVLFIDPDGKLQLTDRQGISSKCPVFRFSDHAFFDYLDSGAPLSDETYEQARMYLSTLI